MQEINVNNIITKSLMGEKNAVNDVLSSLTNNQKVELLSYLYGFEKTPPSIEEVVESDYYLGKFFGNGKLYPFWKDVLYDVFPNPILNPYLIHSYGGAIGIGKSTISEICCLYNIIKFSFLKNAYETFQLESTTPFTVRCFNLTKEKAQHILVEPILERIKSSPYFQEYMRDNNGKLPYNLSIKTGKRAEDIISECNIFSLISETNFFKKEHAQSLISTCLSRMTSRLQKVRDVFGCVILDSSSTDKNSVVEEFIRNGVYNDTTKVVRASIWEVKPKEYFKQGSFKVYAGSDEIAPHIIEKHEDLSKLDKDRIIIAPQELYKNFKHDIEKTLIDQAGICLDSFADFFSNKETLTNSFQINQPEHFEVVILDFYDDEQLYHIVGKYCLENIPKNINLYVRIDLGITNDYCGLSIAHIDEEDYRVIDGVRIFNPKICVPLAISIGRKFDQETSIQKIENFIVWLNKNFSVKMVSTDQFQSTGIRQTLTKLNIPNKLLSVDRTDVPYITFKNLINYGNVKLPKNSLLKQELTYLQRIGGKVDHLDCYSKDCADAVCGAIYTIIEDGVDSINVPKKMKVKEFSNLLSTTPNSIRKLKII